MCVKNNDCEMKVAYIIGTNNPPQYNVKFTFDKPGVFIYGARKTFIAKEEKVQMWLPASRRWIKKQLWMDDHTLLYTVNVAAELDESSSQNKGGKHEYPNCPGCGEPDLSNWPDQLHCGHKDHICQEKR
jgi:hypothetical protein